MDAFYMHHLPLVNNYCKDVQSLSFNFFLQIWTLSKQNQD
jgi:hypothetical protein